MTKINKWQLTKWEAERIWRDSWIRRTPIIGWAYLKLYWASWFIKDDNSPLLYQDISALFAMNSKEKAKYQKHLVKIRNKIHRLDFD